MEHCEICPYPAKCDARGRCQIGEPPVAKPVEVKAKPKAVKKKESK